MAAGSLTAIERSEARPDPSVQKQLHPELEAVRLIMHGLLESRQGLHGSCPLMGGASSPSSSATTILVVARSEATKQSRFTAANGQPGTRFFAPLWLRSGQALRSLRMTFRLKCGCSTRGAVKAAACALSVSRYRSTTISTKGAGWKRNSHYLLRAIVGQRGKEVIATDTYMTRSPSAHFSIHIQKEEYLEKP